MIRNDACFAAHCFFNNCKNGLKFAAFDWFCCGFACAAACAAAIAAARLLLCPPILPNGFVPGAGSVTGAGLAGAAVAAVAMGGAALVAVAVVVGLGDGGAPSLPGAKAVGIGLSIGVEIGLGAATRSVFLVNTTICVVGEPFVGLNTKRVG